MNLQYTTEVLKIALGGTVTTNPVVFIGSYESEAGDGSFGGSVSGATPVVMVNGPRKATWLAVYNADTVAQTVSLYYGSVVFYSGLLAAGQTLSWSAEGGFSTGATVISGNTIAVDVITEQTAGAGVTADGVLLKDATVTTATIVEGSAGSGVTADGFKMKDSGWDATGLTTGTAYIGLTDNLASALVVKEGANAYLTYDTRNDRERVTLGKILQRPSQAIDMADVAVTLVYGTAGAGEVKILTNLLFVDANSSGTEILTLPPVATSSGVEIDVFNTGGESIVVKDVAAATIATVATGKGARFGCNGANWFGLLGT